jgi:fructose-1,6-bisphosphatase I/sedoheptulose-1,7-bisphosphatase
MIMEQACGRVSTGAAPAFEVMPTGLHQRIGVVFGSKSEVERIERYHAEPDEVVDNNPLFNSRSLFRL